MGCKQSKQVRVQPVGPAEANKGKLKGSTSENDAGIVSDIDDKRRRNGKRSKSSKSRRSMGSCGSLDEGRSLDSDRGGSAGSKKSNDSGLGDLGEYNHGFITEHSDPDQVRRIEENFVEREGLGEFVWHTFVCLFFTASSEHWFLLSLNLPSPFF